MEKKYIPKLEDDEILIIQYTGPPEGMQSFLDCIEDLKLRETEWIVADKDIADFIIARKDQVKMND